MSLQLHRLTDCNDAGGCVTSIPQATVFANNLLVSVDGSIGTSHSPCEVPVPIHCEGNWVTNAGGPTVIAVNIPVNKLGDSDTCGHSRAAGSPNVFLNNVSYTPLLAPVHEPGTPPPQYPGLEAEYNLEAATPLIEAAGRFAVLDEAEESSLTPVAIPSEDASDSVGSPAAAAEPGYPEDNPPPSQPPDTAPIPPPAPEPTPPPGPCGGLTEAIDSHPLSANYTLGDFSTGALFPHTVIAQGGRTIGDIICNLEEVAKNIVEPLVAQFGPIEKINAGFRKGSGTSQHKKGMAVDIQFPGISNQEYFTRAQWVATNIIFDQFLFEHGNSIWFHLSYNRETGVQRKNILTMLPVNGVAKYSPGITLHYA